MELEQQLKSSEDAVMYKITNNLEYKDIQSVISDIEKIKACIRDLVAKYKLKPTEVFLSQIINAKKTGMWEILCDTTSKNLKGFGKFPEEYAREFDSDIDVLQKLIAGI